MPQTPREIVRDCLTFNSPERIPRDLWLLPWAENHYPEQVKQLQSRYPGDFVTSTFLYPPSPRVKGAPYQTGTYVDEWGCEFVNLQDGIIGEVRKPSVPDISDWRKVKPPYELLKLNIAKAGDQIKRHYDATDKFVLANICPRPWERYQFLRGSENALIDVMFPEEGGKELLRIIHEFYLKEMEFWVKTSVDAIMFMDDWGSQNQLLIPPAIWRELFKPLYRDYCDLVRANGKFAFMHSDGYISEIYEDLVDVGVDAINSQLFCMDLQDLAKRVKGKITFWGEIDRQHILPAENPQESRNAVREVAKYLYDPRGGVIAQFELGAGANPQNGFAIFEEWEKVTQERAVSYGFPHPQN